MAISTIILALAVLAAALAWYFRPHPVFSQEPTEIPFSDVRSQIEEFLLRARRPGSFIVFLTDQTGADGGAGFAQVSVNSDGIGVDHVLSCEVNERLAPSFIEFLEHSELSSKEVTGKGIRVIRVPSEQPAELCVKVLAEVFGLRSSATLAVLKRAA